MEPFQLVVEQPEDVGTRLDVFVCGRLEDMSRSGVQKLVDACQIMVNDAPVKANYKVKMGDVVEVAVPEPVALIVAAEDIALDILFEDKDVIVINKPQGMVVHPAAGHASGTLVNGLMFHCGDQLSGINGVMRPGIVHRIDKDTTGVLVVAKTNVAHLSLSEQLANHTMTRVYTAIVCDGIAQDKLTINKPIGRHPSDRKKMAVTQKHSKQAITHIQVLERIGKYTLIEARLETGRTHQIRVHMASIGHPLLGDTVYGRKSAPFNTNGQVLHARLLGFNHPVTNVYMAFEAPLPPEFVRALTLVRGLGFAAQ